MQLLALIELQGAPMTSPRAAARTPAVDLKSLVREVPDFPKPGILFKDITTLLRDGRAMRLVIEALASRLASRGIDYVVGIESRGFMLACPLACTLGLGFVPLRKAGKLPGPTVALEYQLEYGSDIIEIHEGAIEPGARVIIVDDLLATGGTAAAAATLVQRIGACVEELLFLIELEALQGRNRLPAGVEVFALMPM